MELFPTYFCQDESDKIAIINRGEAAGCNCVAQKDTDMTKATKPQHSNGRESVLEVFLTISEEDMKNSPERIEVPDEKYLHMVVESRPPNCSEGGQNRYIRERFPLYIYINSCGADR